MHKSLSLILGSMLLTAAAGGCVMDDDYAALSGEDISSDQQEVWSIGSSVASHWWDSGITTNLSIEQGVTCAATYGSSYLLTRLRGWREPAGNLDNFVARLKARCTEYNPVSYYMQQDTNTHVYEQVYSDTYDSSRDGISAIDATTVVPTGLRIALDPNSDYVKDVALLHGHFVNNGGFNYIDNYASPHQEEWAMGIAGSNTRTLDCPDQFVMAGVKVRYSTNNGKIRYLKVFCRDAADL